MLILLFESYSNDNSDSSMISHLHKSLNEQSFLTSFKKDVT